MEALNLAYENPYVTFLFLFGIALCLESLRGRR